MSVKYKVTTLSFTSLFALATALAPLGLASIAVTQAGCGILGSPGPSAVSRGQKYESGDPTFDEFFSELYDMQIELGKAPDSEKKIREDLAKGIKLDEGSSTTLLSKKVGKRAEELAAAGTGLKLEVKGLEEGEDPAASMSVKGKELTGDDKDMVEAVEKAAGDAAKLYVRMRKARKTIEQFQGKMLALEPSMDGAFRKGGPSKKAEVRKNMEDAKKLIPLMDARIDEVGEAAKTLAKKLEEAAATDNGQFEKPAPPPEPPPAAEEPEPEPGKAKKGEKGEKPKGEKPKGEKPAGEKPAGEKPAGEKKPSQDFEP